LRLAVCLKDVPEIRAVPAQSFQSIRNVSNVSGGT
jgi:hypothetical protein